MDYRLHDLRQLSELLEAEANGRPFDRTHARRLAQALAEHQPEIGNTMRLICERLKQGDARD
ncbi:MAG: hypothetical protein NVV74_16815 [Magnetospirillum sp.]|nr:hypothetical protein [Magnetospirillum sp.]